MANHGWSAERRQRQAELVKNWKPWLQSTGPKSVSGKHKVSRNAFKGGQRAKIRDMNSHYRAAIQSLSKLSIA